MKKLFGKRFALGIAGSLVTALTVWASHLGIRRVKQRERPPLYRPPADDVFGSIDRVEAPPVVPRRRKAGGGSRFGVVKTQPVKTQQDDKTQPVKTQKLQKQAAVNIPPSAGRVSSALRNAGLAVLVAKIGPTAVITVRDDTRTGSRIHGADPTFTSISDVLQRVGAGAVSASGVTSLNGDTAVVQAFANPNAKGHWTATVRVGSETMVLNIVDPGAYRTAARSLGERPTSAIPHLTPADGRPAFAGRENVQSLRAQSLGAGIGRGIEKGTPPLSRRSR